MNGNNLEGGMLSLSPNAMEVLRARYLLKDADGNVIETPSQLFRRVAVNVMGIDLYYEWEKFREGKFVEGGDYWIGFEETYPVLFSKFKKMIGQELYPDFIEFVKHYKTKVPERVEEMYELMSSLTFLPNSPTLMNAGTNLGLSACFVLPVEDDIESIFEAVKYQAIVQKSGGGTGFSFSHLRGKDSIVGSTKGVASGAVSFMKIFDTATDVIKQGGKRRGANMGILNYNHPDIMEFITSKDVENKILKNFNISVGMTDEFFKLLEEGKNVPLVDPHSHKVVGHVPAKLMWEKIVDGAWTTGDPGLIFLDRINEDNPLSNSMKIEATNPCVSADTLLFTEKGIFTVGELFEKQIAINPVIDDRFNGERIGLGTNIFSTGVKKLYKVQTKEGYFLKATDYHPIYSEDRKAMIPLKDLKVGERIRILKSGGAFGNEGNLEEGRILGYFVGDGTLSSRCSLGFWGEDRKFTEEFSKYISNISGKNVTVRHYPELDKDIIESSVTQIVKNAGLYEYKFTVPFAVFSGSEEMQVGFLQGLFQADGTVNISSKSRYSVRLTSISYSMLQEIQQLLLNFGVYSRIYKNRKKEGEKMLPDGKGGKKSYHVQNCHELVITRKSIRKFYERIGFIGGSKQEKLEKIANSVGFYNDKFSAEIESIDYVGEEDVYDLTEFKTHSLVFNGIVTSNCGEVPLFPYESCNLGSINLDKFVEGGEINYVKLNDVVEKCVRFLDNVIDANNYPVFEIGVRSREVRRIGLGVMGFADALISLGIPYDSYEAVQIGGKLMHSIRSYASLTSERLAEEKGAFPLYEETMGRPMRNIAVTSIAPTGTISIIANCSSGIEPLFALSYHRKVLHEKGLDELNEKLLGYQNLFTKKDYERMIEEGSIKNTGLPERIKSLFKISHEIDPKWHVLHQAEFQKYVDNGVSKTINLPETATKEQISEIYKLAYKMRCKGITVYRNNSKVIQVLNAGKKKEKPTFDIMVDPTCKDGTCTL